LHDYVAKDVYSGNPSISQALSLLALYPPGSLRLTQSGGYTCQTYPMQADFFVTKSKVKQFALLKWFAEHKRGGKRRAPLNTEKTNGRGDTVPNLSRIMPKPD